MPRLAILASFRKILLSVLVLALAWSCAEVFELPGPRLAPRIRAVAPGLGTEGTRVSISGKNFSPVPGNNQVKFNGQTATVVAATDTQLVAQVPAHAGTGPVEVVVGNLAAEGPEFLFFETPVVRDITPKEGVAGTEVVIQGQYFDTTATHNTVQFGGKTATVLPPASDSLLRVSVPSDAQSGPVTVTVNGFTGTGPRFTVIGTNEPVLTITGIAPTSGTAGTAVTITGENFSTTPQSNTVRFNGKVANVQSARANQLIAVVPEAAGTGIVSVTVNGKTANGPVFTYIDNTPAPTISNYDPNLGKAGDLIAIVGTNFSLVAGNNVVKFNGVTATVVPPTTATLLNATVPQGATTGPVTVTVGTKTGTGPVFTVLDNSPTIADFNPKQGPVGTQLLITGTNFGNDPAAITVKFNGVTTPVQEAGGITLIVDVPMGATTGKITVTVAGKTATSTVDFVVTTPESRSWKPTGSLITPRTNAVPVLLNNGKVLLVGGVSSRRPNEPLPCQLYDPATGTWTETGAVRTSNQHQAVLLRDGRVLMIGGVGLEVETKSCYLYNPNTGVWTETGSLNEGRYSHQAVVLPNGKVLVAGGVNPNIRLAVGVAEIYDPATGQWTTTGTMIERRVNFKLSLLPNGQVLASGGIYVRSESYSDYTSTCELYNPATGTWSLTGRMTFPRDFTQTISLENGYVLTIGGIEGVAGGGPADSEFYNPATGRWTITGPLHEKERVNFAAVLLDNGQVLISGGMIYGSYPTTYLKSCELYDPATGQFSQGTDMNEARVAHGLIRLRDGRVLAIASTLAESGTCEIYTP